MKKPLLTSRQKQLIRERACGCCEYCLSQEAFSPSRFSVDHVKAHAAGGTTALENLALACQLCNNKKFIYSTATDPITGQTVELYNPRKHQWPEHFRWNQDCSLLLGKTPVGRAMILKLDLNRENVVNLRKILYAAGKHPPF